MWRIKKPRLDFGAIRASTQALLASARTLEKEVQSVKETFQKESPKDHAQLHRFLEKCSGETLELMLVSRLGLEGVECLRNAMQLVPESFLEKRAQFVCAIVNKVSHKQPLEENECRAFMTALSTKFGPYCKRVINPATFDNELWQLTNETGQGFTCFLGPPVTYCTKPECQHNQLTAANTVNVSVFDFHGVRPASKLSLRCRKCGCMYNYSMFGRKLLSGEQYYDSTREFVEASDIVFMSRCLYDFFTTLSLHCCVSFSGFAEVVFHLLSKHEDKKQIMKAHSFVTDLSRKAVSDAFFSGELHEELNECGQKPAFHSNEDREYVMKEIESERVTSPYPHSQTEFCKDKGCGRCWSLDGNWKLGFVHCMYPVKSKVQGFPLLNYPDVCTEEPMPGKAFCIRHCTLAHERDVPSNLREYLNFRSGKDETWIENSTCEHHPVAKDQGTEEFLLRNRKILENCITVSTTLCNKDTGDRGKLQSWSRGHLFIVRPCGHIDTWHPLYRSESPSQVFLITVQWLFHVLKDVPEIEWGQTILAYDNMCHLDGLKAAREDLPLPAPYNKMWEKVTKIIDSLHIRNHKDPKCKEIYHPKKVKDKNPKYNLMCAEQTFAWLSRYKRICSAMNKTHHCFFLHRIVKRRNKYTEMCLRALRSPLLPGI